MGKNKRNRRNKQKSKVEKAAKKTFAAGSSSASLDTLIKNAVVRLKNRKGSTPPEIRACITSSVDNLPKKFPSKLNTILMKGFPGLIKVVNMNKNRGAAFNLKRTRFKYQPPAESVPVHVAVETTTVENEAVSEEAGGVFVEKVVDEVVEKERQSSESSTTTTTTTVVLVKPVVDLSIMRENIKRRKLERDGAAAQAGGWNIDREGAKFDVTN